MSALLAKHSTSFKSFKKGEKVLGTITEKRPKMLVLDIGGKSEAVVAEKAYETAKGFIENLSVGDKVETVVLIPETIDGYSIVSLRQAATDDSWKKLDEAKKKGSPVPAVGRFPSPSGMMVVVYGVYGFVPNSHLSKKALKNKEKLVGKEISSIVIEVSRNSNRLILSEKAVSEGITPSLIQDALKRIKAGGIYPGAVTTISDFGCFVEIIVKVGEKDIPVEGLVHVSEVSWEKVGDLGKVLSRGDKVSVKVIGVKDSRLSLSIKQAKSDPWDEVSKKYKVDKKIEGKVAKMTDFGVFVELTPGVEGLIHITKIPPDRRLKVGDKVGTVIEEFDPKGRKISLGLILTKKPLLYK